MKNLDVLGDNLGWRWLACVLGLMAGSCSSGLDVEGHPATQSASPAVTAAAPPASPQVEGQFLARVSLTPTHTIEFWEIQPGNVMMIQAWDTAHGEQKLELESQLRNAGGKYSALYRNLTNDPNAALSAELVAADEHRSSLPIRDVSLPPPAEPAPLHAPAAHGPVVTTNAPAAQPGSVQTLGVQHVGGGSAAFVSPSWCNWVDSDGGWCPPGAYGNFANGNVQETIYWDAIGHNPQGTGGGADYMNVNQWENNPDGSWSWHSVFFWGLAPGHSVEAYTSSTPTYYQGSITGTFVSYAELWRLSFPSLTWIGSYPYAVSNEFANDIQGLTYSGSQWYLSRTEYNFDGTPYHGVIGTVALTTDLQHTSDPAREQSPEPAAWINTIGYDHFGDIVYDPWTNYVFISMTMAGNVNGAVGVMTWDNHYVGSYVINRWGGCAWVAVNPRDHACGSGMAFAPYSTCLYGSNGDATAIHPYIVTVPPPGGTGSSQNVVATQLSDVALVNLASTPKGYIEDIEGGKVSSHGKLWVFSNNKDSSGENRSGMIYGIDPYTGIIQVAGAVQFGVFSDEAEGLVLTEPYLNSMGVYVPALPASSNIPGEVHAMHLENNGGDDQWDLQNYRVSDVSRL